MKHVTSLTQPRVLKAQGLTPDKIQIIVTILTAVATILPMLQKDS